MHAPIARPMISLPKRLPISCSCVCRRLTHRETRSSLGRSAWAEEWLRGGNEFWDEYDSKNSGRLGAATETKSQYLHLLEETLRRASHIRNWAVAHVETGFITTQDIVDTIADTRRVDTIYTKDFSELTGAKAVIITA